MCSTRFHGWDERRKRYVRRRDNAWRINPTRTSMYKTCVCGGSIKTLFPEKNPFPILYYGLCTRYLVHMYMLYVQYTSTRIYMYEYPCIYLCSIGGAKKNASTTSTSIYLVHTKCTINSGNAVKRLTKSCLSYVTRKCFVRASCNPPCSGKGCTSRHKPHTRTQRRRAVQNLSVVLLLLLLL